MRLQNGGQIDPLYFNDGSEEMEWDRVGVFGPVVSSVLSGISVTTYTFWKIVHNFPTLYKQMINSFILVLFILFLF